MIRRNKKFHITIPQDPRADPLRTLCRPNTGYLRSKMGWVDILYATHATLPMCKTCLKYAKIVDVRAWDLAWRDVDGDIT